MMNVVVKEEGMRNAKSILSSWTFWFGVAQLFVGISGFATGTLDQELCWSLITTGSTTIGLRYKTDKPVRFTL